MTQTLTLGRTLKFGMSGDDVRALQLALASRGYQLSGTGYFGSATDSAVRSFQRANSLVPVDGAVGTNTIAKLNDQLTSVGSQQQQVFDAARPLWLQEALSRIGTKELAGGGDNPLIIEWAKELGGNVASEYTHDSIPWCALFIDSCLSRAGQKPLDTLYALDYAKYGLKLPGPAVGAIASMVRTGGGHVVIVIGRDKAGNLACVGGNQSDAVNVRSFPPDRIHSYNWPSTASPPTQVGFSSLPLVQSDGTVSTKES